ncbi:MAG: diaminopimelate epimerase [Polyangia bacterium]
MSRHFFRAHGLGNDYLVVGEDFGLPMTAARAIEICDRNRGVGSDGVLVAGSAPEGFDATVRIFNPDGSEAEKSGNGVRIFAAWCFRTWDRSRPLRISTLGGPVTARFLETRDHADWLRVSMGRVHFEMSALPMLEADGGAGDRFVARALKVGDEDVVATCLSVGNPHAVLVGATCDESTLLRLGPRVERHAQFPRRTNVQLCEVLDRRRVRALIWERGAGPTLASGSSACAVVAACAEAGTVDRDADISVVMPGGTLLVRIDGDGELEQVGPVQHIADGTIADGLWGQLSDG